MKLAAARYTDRPFPDYAFRPGRTPHPFTDPKGHSYRPPGSPPPPRAVLRDPQQWRDSPEYLFGCDLYNHGYWWEAHEAWESLWQLTDKADVQGRFLKGLIQVAAAHLKLALGKPRPARRLQAKAETHLRFVLDRTPSARFMGLRLDRWVEAVDAYYRCVPVDASAPPAHDAATFPYIVLCDS
jgi:hypothetical protein